MLFNFIRFTFFLCWLIGLLNTMLGCRNIAITPQHTAPAALDSLGRYLFFDTRLSANGGKSCASCHDPAYAFSDGYRQSVGTYGDPLRRNAPSLLNTRYFPTLNWAAQDVHTFEQQMQGPLFLQTPPELGLWPDAATAANSTSSNQYTPKTIIQVLEELRKDSVYQRLFARAFPQQDQTFAPKNMFRAIAAYERTLVSNTSAYDRFMAGDSSAFGPSAQRGMDLFFGEKLHCASCHTPPLFSDGRFYQVRLGDDPAETADRGLFEKTHQAQDLYRFRTPSLRNIALTAPYTHDGSIATLADLLTVFETAAQGNHPDAQPIHLTPTERRDLIVFLESLTDPSIAQNPWFQNPWPVQ